MTTIYNVYDDLAQILARLDASGIKKLKATNDLQERFDSLTGKSKNNQLTESEQDELAHYIVLERLMRLAKIRTA